MKVVASRVKSANVKVDNKIVGECEKGLLLLVGFTDGDSEKEIDQLVKKCLNLRIFDDENGVMNKSVLDIEGTILSISQFTLYGDASKGNRPSYVKAMKGEEATKLFDIFNNKLNEFIHTETGVFGADMQITAHHDGPVTIMMESK